MQSIPREYLLLFNALTEMEETLRGLRSRIITVQQQAEELFLEEGDAEEAGG